MMQQSFRCVLCGHTAEGYIEDVKLGWRDEENNKVYLCKEDFKLIYKNLRYAWHPLE